MMGTSNEASNTAGIKQFFGGLADALKQRARYGDIEDRLMQPASCDEDRFYLSLAGCQLADEWLKHKLEKHIASGDTSKLANYVGMCRRTFDHLPQGELGALLKVAVAILRKDGRTVNLSSANPREWISRANGSPRW